MELTPSYLEIDPKLVLEVAVGLEAPGAIAARYGFEDEAWEALQGFKPFVHAVEAKRAELQMSGFTFKMKAAMAAEDLLGTVYRKALSSEVHIKDQLEVLKYLSKMGDLEPEEKPVRAGAGTGFSLTINIPGSTAPIQINATPAKAPIESMVEDDLLADPPPFLTAAVDNTALYYDEAE